MCDAILTALQVSGVDVAAVSGGLLDGLGSVALQLVALGLGLGGGLLDQLIDAAPGSFNRAKDA